MEVQILRGQPILIRHRLMAGHGALDAGILVRIEVTEPCEVRTAASTRERHSRYTGSSPVLRSTLTASVAQPAERATRTRVIGVQVVTEAPRPCSSVDRAFTRYGRGRGMKSHLGLQAGDPDADQKTSALIELVLRAHPDHFGKAGTQDADQRQGVCGSFDEAHDLSGRLSTECYPAAGV